LLNASTSGVDREEEGIRSVEEGRGGG
jgi:hypothetical protein